MATDEMDDALRDSKFSHLLKPIRDLAENWNIDVATELEEYLTHLDRTAFSFQGGPTLDFAEAALVIQSSACVYSKKVEHLHNLAYQALEAVRSKRRQADGDEEDNDTVEGFLAAAAVLRSLTADYKKDMNNSNGCGGGVDLDVEDGDGDAGVFHLAHSHVHCSKAFLLDARDGDAGVFHLAHCHVHCSGALLLDARDGDNYDKSLNWIGRGVAGQLGDQASGDRQFMALGGAPLGGQGRAGGEPSLDDDEDEEGGGFGAGGFGEDDDDDDAVGAVGVGKEPVEGAAGAPGAAQVLPPPSVTSVIVEVKDTVMAGAEEKDKGGALQGMPPPAVEVPGASLATASAEVAEQKYFDPYEPLDFDAPERTMDGVAPLAGLCHQEFSYAAELLHLQATKKAPKASSKGGQAMPQGMFDWEDAAAAAADLAGDPAADQDPASTGVDRDGETGATGGADDDSDGGGGGFGADGFGGDDDDDDGRDMYGVRHGMELDVLANHSAAGGGNSIGICGRHGMELDVLAGHTAAGDGNSYEDLCRSHMEAMTSAAAARVVQSELAVRVSGWRSRIDPVLKYEESRSGFDIHVYADKILGRLTGGQILDKLTGGQDKDVDAANNTSPEAEDAPAVPTDFSSITSRLHKYEVSRLFSAMLQLINNRNVDIHKGDTPDAPFQLQLLNADQLHESIGDRLGDTGKGAAQGTAKGGPVVKGGVGQEHGGDGEMADDAEADVLMDLKNRALERGSKGGKAKPIVDSPPPKPRSKKARGKA
eukprot:gene22300-29377_t